MYTNNDIAQYYNNTLSHYVNWWKLKQCLSLHYGIWDKNVKSFKESLANTNKKIIDQAGITSSMHILDAGCGVGGSAISIAQTTGATVSGITLSEKQVEFAQPLLEKTGLKEKVNIQTMDFCNTTFSDCTFDVVFAIESMMTALDKEAFIKEAYRILKPNGILLIYDMFLTKENQPDTKEWMRKCRELWAISSQWSSKRFIDAAIKQGLSLFSCTDHTKEVYPSVRRMFMASILGALPNWIFFLIKRKKIRFGENHYKIGFYQYKAYKANLWKYQCIYFKKLIFI